MFSTFFFYFYLSSLFHSLPTICLFKIVPLCFSPNSPPPLNPLLLQYISFLYFLAIFTLLLLRSPPPPPPAVAFAIAVVRAQYILQIPIPAIFYFSLSSHVCICFLSNFISFFNLVFRQFRVSFFELLNFLFVFVRFHHLLMP